MDSLVSALKAVADPTRLRILALCAHGDLTVSDLTRILGQSQPRVSRHLKLLCQAGLLDRLREGSWVFFRAAHDGWAAGLGQTLVDAMPPEDPLYRLDLERLETVMAERARRAAAYFDRNAAQWDEIRSLYVDELDVEQRLLKLVTGETVADLLDIGTGTGRIMELLAPHVGHAEGIDLSSEMLVVARSKLEQAGLRNCRVRKGDMYQLPFPSGSFDLVTIHQVLHFAEWPNEAIAEAARVLRSEGRLVIVDFLDHDLDVLRDEHQHRWLGFDPDQIGQWCEAAGLDFEPPIALPGGTLTVGIWSGRRRAVTALHRPRAAGAL